MNKLIYTGIFVAISSIITTMGVEQLLVYGTNKLVVYKFLIVTEWVLPYTLIMYGLIFLIFAIRYDADSIFIYMIFYLLWDIQALVSMVNHNLDGFNLFYLLILFVTLMSAPYIIKKYQITIQWKYMIIYFAVFPILSHSLSTLQESVNAISFSMLFMGLKVKDND